MENLEGSSEGAGVWCKMKIKGIRWPFNGGGGESVLGNLRALLVREDR